MKSYVILGDTGFIGSAFFRHLTSINKKVIGINRSRVTMIEKTNVKEYSRKSNNLFKEMEQHLTEAAYKEFAVHFDSASDEQHLQ